LRIYNRYILALVICASLINVVLAFWGQTDLEVYFTVNIIGYLIITLLYVYLNPKAKRALNTISFVLFGCFMVIVTFKVMEIITGR